MNDTFSQDAWKKLSQMKQNQDTNCFSNLARKMIQATDDEADSQMNQYKSRHIDVANKVRKSY